MFKNINRDFVIVFAILLFIFTISAGFNFRFGQIGELDQRYDNQHGRTTETIGKLETELERERQINRDLREYNNRARDIAFDLTDTVSRNVRNLQDAISIISEIRTKLKILEDFFNNSSADSGDN